MRLVNFMVGHTDSTSRADGFLQIQNFGWRHYLSFFDLNSSLKSHLKTLSYSTSYFFMKFDSQKCQRRGMHQFDRKFQSLLQLYFFGILMNALQRWYYPSIIVAIQSQHLYLGSVCWWNKLHKQTVSLDFQPNTPAFSEHFSWEKDQTSQVSLQRENSGYFSQRVSKYYFEPVYQFRYAFSILKKAYLKHELQLFNNKKLSNIIAIQYLHKQDKMKSMGFKLELHLSQYEHYFCGELFSFDYLFQEIWANRALKVNGCTVVICALVSKKSDCIRFLIELYRMNQQLLFVNEMLTSILYLNMLTIKYYRQLVPSRTCRTAFKSHLCGQIQFILPILQIKFASFFILKTKQCPQCCKQQNFALDLAIDIQIEFRAIILGLNLFSSYDEFFHSFGDNEINKFFSQILKDASYVI